MKKTLALEVKIGNPFLSLSLSASNLMSHHQTYQRKIDNQRDIISHQQRDQREIYHLSSSERLERQIIREREREREREIIRELSSLIIREVQERERDHQRDIISHHQEIRGREIIRERDIIREISFLIIKKIREREIIRVSSHLWSASSGLTRVFGTGHHVRHSVTYQG
ncbi:hypothetical protein AVEN_125036-1 [Araneus ventricosus]|uniref:Uncharacterized protein n=1 Tax=Araneus ventricosus TaxID=182803 RepID=A0A4Y2GWJ9_ARAVE|nr:hypothetical protein AVEN_125036-1 [Araneus ventricosus]